MAPAAAPAYVPSAPAPLADEPTITQKISTEPPKDMGALDFDLGDMPTETIRPTAPPPAPMEPSLDFGDFKIAGEDAPALPADGDPLARKLELAEEFRQIGDLEGARDLLEEVVAKADGALKSKAQGMLQGLG